MNINFNPSKQPKGVLAQVLTLIGSAVLLVAALMFSAVFLAVIAFAGLILWLYFWWKTRAIRAHLRLQMEQQAGRQGPDSKPQSAESASGDVIEGEAVRVIDERNQLSE